MFFEDDIDDSKYCGHLYGLGTNYVNSSTPSTTSAPSSTTTAAPKDTQSSGPSTPTPASTPGPEEATAPASPPISTS